MSTLTGYTDVQVNGYAGVDFNAPLTPADLRRAAEAMRDEGVARFLPTVITADLDAMCARLGEIAAAVESDDLLAKMVPGVHIEGPFLNPAPGYIGAHPTDHARQANLDDVQRLLDAADGLTRLVTLAPECDPGFEVTRHLADRGVVVSAGHTDASTDQLRGAIDAGLTMFTHLGNGCPMTLHRHDNVIQRALALAEHLTISFIADGVHVPLHALGNYLWAVPDEHVVIVSDAIAAAGLGPGEYPLGERSVVVGDDGATWAADRSHLVGSACPLHKMEANLRFALRIDDDRLRQWLVANPARMLGLPEITP